MPTHKLLLAGLASSAVLLTACGGSDSTSRSTPTPQPTATPAPTATPTPTPTPTVTPTPTPTPGPSTSKVEGPLDPVQDDVVDGIVVNQLSGQLPAPFDQLTVCTAQTLNYLIDVPDAVLAGVEGLANGADPFAFFNSSAADAQAALGLFAASLQSTLLQLVDRGSCDPDADPTVGAGNPLSGTPLAAIGEEIADLVEGFPEEGATLDVEDFATVVSPLLSDLAAALGGLPPEVQDAPILGGAMGVLQQAMVDVANMLIPFGGYQGGATATAAETVIQNLLTGVLVDTLPVAELDAPLAADIGTAISTAVATLGSSLGNLVSPLFVEGLDGVIFPLLDPEDGLLAGIDEDGNPLEGLLAALAGDTAGTPVDALLAAILSGIDGSPLQAIINASGGSSELSDSPLSVLGALRTQNSGAALDSLLGTAVTQNTDLGASLSTILGGLLDNFLIDLL